MNKEFENLICEKTYYNFRIEYLKSRIEEYEEDLKELMRELSKVEYKLSELNLKNMEEDDCCYNDCSDCIGDCDKCIDYEECEEETEEYTEEDCENCNEKDGCIVYQAKYCNSGKPLKLGTVVLIKDLKLDKNSSQDEWYVGLNQDMLQYQNRIATVVEVEEEDMLINHPYIYRLDIDGGRNSWVIDYLQILL